MSSSTHPGDRHASPLHCCRGRHSRQRNLRSDQPARREHARLGAPVSEQALVCWQLPCMSRAAILFPFHPLRSRRSCAHAWASSLAEIRWERQGIVRRDRKGPWSKRLEASIILMMLRSLRAAMVLLQFHRDGGPTGREHLASRTTGLGQRQRVCETRRPALHALRQAVAPTAWA